MGPEVWATGLLHRKEIIVAIVCCYRITISCVLCRSWRSSFFFSDVVAPPRKGRSKPQHNAPNIYHRSPARRLRQQQRRQRRRLLHAGDERTMFNSYLDFVHPRAMYVFSLLSLYVLLCFVFSFVCSPTTLQRKRTDCCCTAVWIWYFESGAPLLVFFRSRFFFTGSCSLMHTSASHDLWLWSTLATECVSRLI